MERLPPHVETIYLATPSLARDEILHAIADDLELRLTHERTTVALRELQEHLIRLYGAGRRVVVLIDEAHVMPEQTLEQLRLLSNLESNRHKLMQLVLFGQPELDATLAKPSLRQLRDRITHAFRMRPLSEPEVAKYVSFRMRAAGYRGPDVFAPGALARVARASGGLTRRINILADKSLLAAFTQNVHAITERHVRAAIADSEFARLRRPRRPAVYAGAALAAGVVIGAAVHWAFFARAVKLDAPVAQIPAIPPAQAAPVPVAATKEPDPPPPPASLLMPDQVRRFGGYSPAGQRLPAERIAATPAVLERVPDQRFAIELFITDNTDPARVERFLVRARELVPLGELFVIPVARGGQYRLRVIFGEFSSRAAAIDAGAGLAPAAPPDRSPPRARLLR